MWGVSGLNSMVYLVLNEKCNDGHCECWVHQVGIFLVRKPLLADWVMQSTDKTLCLTWLLLTMIHWPVLLVCYGFSSKRISTRVSVAINVAKGMSTWSFTMSSISALAFVLRGCSYGHWSFICLMTSTESSSMSRWPTLWLLRCKCLSPAFRPKYSATLFLQSSLTLCCLRELPSWFCHQRGPLTGLGTQSPQSEV